MKALDALEIPLQGLNLIEASAGTGKTYTITTLVVRLLTESPYYSIDKLLVVTFTNAATAELRDRVRDRISQVLSELEQALQIKAISNKVQRQEPPAESQDELVRSILKRSTEDISLAQSHLSDALREFDRAPIYTIHGFCQRTLQENAFECGIRFDTELIENDKALHKNAVCDFWNNEIANQDPFFIQYLDEKRLDTEHFLELASRRASNAEATVLPSASPISKIDYSAYNQAYAQVFALWSDPDCRAEVEEIILHSKDLHRNKIQNADKKVEALQKALANEFPDTPSLSESFGLVATASSLNECTLAGARNAGKLVGDSHAFFKLGDALWTEFEKLKDQRPNLRLCLELKLLTYLGDNIRQRKTAENVQSYHDLLQLLDEGLDGANGKSLAKNLATRFPVALIDEFQDTDPIQFRIFSKIYSEKHHPVFLIGDPKQAIYSFRSADIFAYQRAARKAASKAYTLGTNWRSDPKLIAAVNHIFESVDAPFFYKGIDFSAVAPRPNAENVFTVKGELVEPLTIQILDSEGLRNNKNIVTKDMARKEIVRRTAAHIANSLDPDAQNMIRGELIHPGQIAVLVRANAEAAQIQDALRDCRVPSVIQGAGSVFNSKESDDLYILLSAIADPSDTQQLRAALASDIIGLRAVEIVALNHDEAAWTFWKSQFLDWHEAWNKFGFVQMMRGLLIWSAAGRDRIQTHILRFPDGERRITNVLHLTERLHDRARAGRMGAHALLRWFEEQRSDPATDKDAEELRLETDDRAVKIITIHKSKGLQYPIVYCPFLWDGRLLDKSAKNFLCFHDEAEPHGLNFALGSEITDDRTKLASDEAFAESLRILYVALTRAQHRVLTVFGAINGVENSALAHFLSPSTEADLCSPRGESIAANAEDEALLENCKNLAARKPGTISVELLSHLNAKSYRRRGDQAIELKCRPSERNLPLVWRKSSYSGLVGQTVGPSVHTVPERDHDEEEAETSAQNHEPEEAPTIILDGFIRNAVAGDCFHEIYENIDFTNAAPDHIESVVKEKLSAYGFDPNAWSTRVCQAIGESLDTSLDKKDPDFRLRSLSQANRLNEMQFLFPVAHEGRNLNAEGLSAVFQKHAKTPLDFEYAESLARLSFGGLRGYLKGFIDLVFRYQDKWYIADYKSNYLGKHHSDYASTHLRESMIHKHYVLQYHVYSVALHRHLKQRMPNYNYDNVFGGAFYFYIKGMSPKHGPDSGVFFERPSEAMILDLDALFSGASVSGELERQS